MLLVDDDHAQPGNGGEHRRARSHHHPRLAGRDPPVLVPPPGRRQTRVEHRHRAPEAGPEAVGRLRGERDLGDQHDRSPAQRKRPRDHPQVDLGLAGARHPVQQQLAARPRPAPPGRPRRRRPAPPSAHRRRGCAGPRRGRAPAWRAAAEHQRKRPGQGRPALLGNPVASSSSAGGIRPTSSRAASARRPSPRELRHHSLEGTCPQLDLTREPRTMLPRARRDHVIERAGRPPAR